MRICHQGGQRHRNVQTVTAAALFAIVDDVNDRVTRLLRPNHDCCDERPPKTKGRWFPYLTWLNVGRQRRIRSKD